MAFLIGGANTLDDAYTIDNSLRFSDSNYLTIDNTDESGEGVNFTLSVWLKMTSYDVGGYQGIFSVFKDSNDYFEIYKDNSEKLQICQNINGTNVCYQNQGFAFRDYSAWYHLVVSFNNSASGEVNKIKVYVNGQEISSSEGVTNSNPFADMGLGDSAYDTRVGAYRDNTSATWNGYMSDFNLVAGQTLAASSFGKYDSNAVWVPKKYTGSYGENGFFLEFKETGTSQNSSGMGADTSGNVNHLAVTGLSSVDVTTDTPSNNFCTLNPIDKGSEVNTVTEGNTKATWNGANGDTIRSTMAVANGKWYWETANADNLSCGIVDTEERIIPVSGNRFPGGSGYGSNDSFGYILSDGKTRTNNSQSTYGEAVDNGEILMCALDLDNGKIFWGVDGVWQNSGDPANGTNPAYTGITTGSVFFSPGWGYQTGGSSTVSVNFGNPPFAISSTQADDNGYGSFEYDVPTGFYALCSKNLAEFG